MNEVKARKMIEDEDFSFIRERLKKKIKDGGLGWNQKKVLSVEEHYKGFLFVCWKYRKERQIPTKDIDHFWHNHILYTKKYKNFCDRVFGYFLHHTPK